MFARKSALCTGAKIVDSVDPYQGGADCSVPVYQRRATMNTHYACFVRPALAATCVASLAACGGNSCIGLGTCGGSSVTPNVATSGTGATGSALASATVSFSCVQGSGSTLSDGGGHYSITFNATPPCILTVTSGGISLHSLAFAGGTFNATPETELMLVYIASQLGTNESGLIAGFPDQLAVPAGAGKSGRRAGRAIGCRDVASGSPHVTSCRCCSGNRHTIELLR